MSVISLQTGLREYNGDLSQYTGMLGGLTPDINTLRCLNPMTTNRVRIAMLRGPYFLMHYFGGGGNAYNRKSPFATYKNIIEYWNTQINCNIGDATLNVSPLQGGFAGRSIGIPTTQVQSSNQSLTITVAELVGRPVANFHNMWIDGISDSITGLTHYHGLVAGSVDDGNVPQRLFAPITGASSIALEPSPAWEVAEFLVYAVDRSGARVEAAVMALGCLPSNKIGNDIFNSNGQGSSQIQTLSLQYNCQYVQSTYINDLAARHARQFAIFGNSLNYNPGAGDAFFTDKSTGEIDTAMFNYGKRPELDSVQSGLGNAPVFSASQQRIARPGVEPRTLTPEDHSRIYGSDNTTTEISNPYSMG